MELKPLPDQYGSTRRALHQLAFFAIAPKRHAATGKLGLRCTDGGFGTPLFGDEEQVRFEAGRLVHQRGTNTDRIEVETLRQACDFLEIPYREVWFEDFGDPLPPIGPDARLEIAPKAATALAGWLAFGDSVLVEERLIPDAVEVSDIQLWPEHFDLAFEMGSGPQRGTYGASPGDDSHDEPYLYLAAWEKVDRSEPFWNDTAFNGASLSYRQLLKADDPRGAALGFFQRGYSVLSGPRR